MPKINRIDHIRIVVEDLEPVETVWAPLLGKTAPDDAHVDESEKRPFRECEFALVHPRATNGVLLECIDDMAGSGEAS